MTVDWRIEGPPLAIIATMFALAVMAWPFAPAPRVESLLALPLLALAIYIFMRVLRRIDPPGHYNSTFGGSHTIIRGALLFLLAAMHALRVFRLLP
jgi:hypothetical protein